MTFLKGDFQLSLVPVSCAQCRVGYPHQMFIRVEREKSWGMSHDVYSIHTACTLTLYYTHNPLLYSSMHACMHPSSTQHHTKHKGLQLNTKQQIMAHIHWWSWSSCGETVDSRLSVEASNSLYILFHHSCLHSILHSFIIPCTLTPSLHPYALCVLTNPITMPDGEQEQEEEEEEEVKRNTSI